MVRGQQTSTTCLPTLLFTTPSSGLVLVLNVHTSRLSCHTIASRFPLCHFMLSPCCIRPGFLMAAGKPFLFDALSHTHTSVVQPDHGAVERKKRNCQSKDGGAGTGKLPSTASRRRSPGRVVKGWSVFRCRFRSQRCSQSSTLQLSTP